MLQYVARKTDNSPQLGASIAWLANFKETLWCEICTVLYRGKISPADEMAASSFNL